MSIITTKHKYIDKYPIKKTDEYLILGTIHPHSNKQLDFFYGNKNSLWNIFSEILNVSLNNVNDIVNLLNKNNIAISDMILECNRENEKITSDKDLFDLKLNIELKEKIINSNIHTIFFTSAFNKNNAAKLFFDTFNLKIPTNWKDTYEFFIQLDNKKIKCIILLSPSGAANRAIPKTKIYQMKKEEYEKNYCHPVKQFKIDFYKEKFKNIFQNI